MSTVRFSDEAENDLADAVEWYEGQEPGLGLTLIAHVEAAVELIVTHPAMGTLTGPGTVRRVLVKRFPYAVYYLQQSEHVVVVAILHQRQDRQAVLRRR